MGQQSQEITAEGDHGQPNSEPDQKTKPSLKHKVTDAVASIGPFAGALTAYGLLVDNLQDDWFTYVALKYIFSGIGALCIGFALRLLAVRFSPNKIVVKRSDELLSIPAGSTVPGVSRDTKTPHTIFSATASALQADVRSDKHDGKPLYGWSQYFGDNVPPTAIGTSYGLRIAIALDIRSSDITYGRLTQTLVSLQKPGGGWAASTQRGVGRPEVTAWVLGAAFRAGLDEQQLASLANLLQDLTTADDPIALNRTTVVSSLITTLVDVAPNSPTLGALSESLIQGASIVGADDTPISWGESLQGGTKGSVPHTARAIVALKKAAAVSGRGTRLDSAAEAGISWLVAGERHLVSSDEQLRRHVGGGDVDAIFIGHFTPAWVARAIMAASDPFAYQQELRRAMQAVLQEEHQGVWRWHDDSKPIWMTYQGIKAIRDYALRGFEWPP